MEFITANWDAPIRVKAVTTTRSGGFSTGGYAGLNLGDHVQDHPEIVSQNRALLLAELGLERQPQWLNQVHGTCLVKASDDGSVPEADACWSDEQGLACIVMTADCLPVFFADDQAKQVAVAHAGWRGLLDGVVEKTLEIFADPAKVHVWLGPAIGPDAFEVGPEVLDSFTRQMQQADSAFTPVPDTPEKYMADLYALARLKLEQQGVVHISGGDLCTYTDSERFYSYRRDGQTGRMASLIWIE
ncbi:peptidoglycan editing factor PgeF [uncultured Neptuniibacter sp.]|uniref:peptidoglycan editing factor PgeF n=1 Tax=uncultured Neptuniibacter sp. TaxID=502143 RepID=UPI002609C414|nr:peptidoglycan editing factor PgeF [uncultured Neptuniibacter sp.]